MASLEAETSLEVTITLTGTLTHAEPDVGIMGDGVEGAGISSVDLDIRENGAAANLDLFAGLADMGVDIGENHEEWIVRDARRHHVLAKRKMGLDPTSAHAGFQLGLMVAKARILENLERALGQDAINELLLEGRE